MIWIGVFKALVGLATLGHLNTAYSAPLEAFADSFELLDDEDPTSPQLVQCYTEPLSPGDFRDYKEFAMESSNIAASWEMRVPSITIPVNFHDMGSSENDNLSESIKGQFKVLRATYEKYGFDFELEEIFHYNNPSLSNCSVVGNVADHLPCEEVTRALRKGTYQTLNVFVHRQLLANAPGLPNNSMILGEATSPLDLYRKKITPREALETEGVRIRDITLGDRNPKLRGKTLVHEVGHWLGLLHPFDARQRCNDNDGINDTPVTNHRVGGCPKGLSTCGQLDPIHNHMMYTNDTCRTEFTKGQINIMRRCWKEIRLNVEGSITPDPNPSLR